MNDRRRPSLKSITPTPNTPHTAQPGTPPAALGGPKNAARKGAPTVVGPDPRTGDGRYPVAWLTITAPRGAVPTATSTCECGRNRSAVGHARVHALITDHAAHRDACPLRTNQEGRAAA
jgi:hypothetical protein